MGESIAVTLGGASAGLDRNPVLLEPVHELRDRDPARIDGPAGLQLGDQLGAPDLRLALGALERVPAPLALPLCIAHVDHDGPAAGASLADMAFHGTSPFVFGN